jgi:hypothetical protein
VQETTVPREQAVAVVDGGGKVDQLAVVGVRLLAQHLERAGFVDAVAFHEDALGSLDQRAAPERGFAVVVFGEAAQDDVDRALPVLDVGVADVGEHAALGRLFDEFGIAGVQEHDDRAGGFAHDRVVQIERVLRAFPEADERDVGSLALCQPTPTPARSRSRPEHSVFMT